MLVPTIVAERDHLQDIPAISRPPLDRSATRSVSGEFLDNDYQALDHADGGLGTGG